MGKADTESEMAEAIQVHMESLQVVSVRREKAREMWNEMRA